MCNRHLQMQWCSTSEGQQVMGIVDTGQVISHSTSKWTCQNFPYLEFFLGLLVLDSVS